ncbi:MAG: acyl-CoA dehydrogenase family protein [Proteobacteria bacterium]|nr:acyl-CoA dehydrogenase family protein [Pseudomonadota bacterium]
MDLSYSAEDDTLIGRLDAFARGKLLAGDIALEGRDEPPRDFCELIANAGWFRYLVPKAQGGVFDDVCCYPACLIRERFAMASSFASAVFGVQGLGSFPIVRAGSDALRRRYLPAMAAGERLGAFAVTEREAGSDVLGIQTEAKRRGDHYVLNGAKAFISNAGLADSYVVIARTGEGRSPRSLSAFVVDAETPGFRLGRAMEIIAFDVLGELVFEDCAVPEANRLGREGDGFALTMETLNLYRPTVGAHAVGLAEAAFEAARVWAVGREQFGRPIGKFQSIGFKLADMASEIAAARLMVYRAAKARDEEAPEAVLWASMAKLYATEAAQRVIDEAVQIHGGWGLSKELPLERYYREVRALRVYEGTSEIQKLIIANQLLGKGAD